MSALAIPPSTCMRVREFDNLAELLYSLGDVPPSRVIWTPRPGTATEQDLLRFVEHDKRLCELIDGTLVEKPVGWFESILAMRLAVALSAYVDSRHLGVISGPDGTLKMASGRIRLPDVAFISFESMPGGKLPTAKVPRLAPELAVEILSESNTKAEIDLKLKEYFESGAKLAWVIDPVTQTVQTYLSADAISRTLNVHDDLDGDSLLPGFVIPLSKLFFPRPEKP